MEKLTYKQFEREMNKRGYDVVLNDYYQVFVQYDHNTIVAVDKTKYKELDLYWKHYNSLTDEEKDLVADPCWQLASTPLKDREEPKSYHLKVCPKYSPFFTTYCDYLNIDTRDESMVISSEHETSLYKTIFTEEEINELAKEYDLSLFEKVEVEDEQ